MASSSSVPASPCEKHILQLGRLSSGDEVCDDVKAIIWSFIRSRYPRSVAPARESILVSSTFPDPLPFIFKLPDRSSVGVVASPGRASGVHTVEKVPLAQSSSTSAYEIPHTPLMVCFHQGDVYYVSMFGNRLYRASARSKSPDLIRFPPNCRKVAGLWSLGSHLLLLSADDHHMYTADGNGWRFSSDLAWTDNIVADVALSHDSVEQLQLLQYPKPGQIDCVYRLVRHNRGVDGADELMFSLPLRGAVQMRLLPEAVDGLACVCQQTDGSGKVSSTPSALFTIRVVNFLTGVPLITSEGFSSFGIVSMVVTDAWHVAVMGEVLTEYLDDDDDEPHRVALKGMQFEIHSLTLHA
ncbi:hypothetical protein FOZ61_005864 [Perkinsus olseni]|uniref:Uncharacterized protein n=1 Tax=Perkinsus olseni TaxID=32597 RepID=A0A7J6LFL5_PEROL|nr:hypothetical protein FOZ61_005864 [Perkinsus olseni]